MERGCDKERNTLKKKDVRGGDIVKWKIEFKNEKNSHFSLGVSWGWVKEWGLVQWRFCSMQNAMQELKKIRTQNSTENITVQDQKFMVATKERRDY